MSRHVMPHQRPSLLACCRDGYFFCADCQRVVHQREQDYLRPVCAECGSVKVQWFSPVLSAQDFLSQLAE